MDLLVRTAVEADADAICDAHVAAWRAAYRYSFPAEYLDAQAFEDNRRRQWHGWTHTARSPGSALLVPVIGDRVVGFAHCGRQRADDVGADATPAGEVFGFYLHPDAWGSGAAARLMEACAGYLRSVDVAEAVLWVLRDNPRARAFYERAEWRASGVEQTWAPSDRPDLVVREAEYRRTL